MSYNILRIKKKGSLFMKIDVINSLQKEVKQLPEGCFLNSGDIDDCFGYVDNSGRRELLEVWWYGEGSGSSFSNLKIALSKTEGVADLEVVWEDGEIEKIHVENGKVQCL